MADEKVDVEELEKLERNATAGPWSFNENARGGEGSPAITFEHESLGTTPVVCDAPFWSMSDGHFIVALRNAAPAMLKELRALRSAAKTARAEALEEAAKVCEEEALLNKAAGWEGRTQGAYGCRNRIRSLATDGGPTDGT